MMKGLIIQQQQVEENMSNLTSAASGDQACSVSSNPNPAPAAKKKRNLPGNPDPDAEVIALSPKTLMATNRFVCEICNKGFQRDQNLQLHRRGHNLPWKLKQRSNKEVRKKVYICPEVSCVHHDPSRALGDLTGIKKHFSRKHGEKKWKCEKCSKKYAVQSDWKAHSKICGTREYRCDCGTLFSRRDSFITHRAFCDALAEESARAITNNPLANHHHPLLFSQPPPPQTTIQTSSLDPSHYNQFSQFPNLMMMKRESNQNEFPPWLSCPQSSSTSLNHLDLIQEYNNNSQDQNPAQSLPQTLPPPPISSSHMSATALLQKAAQMGATMSRPSTHQAQMAPAHHSPNPNNAASSSMFGLGLMSSHHQEMMMANGFDPHGSFGEAMESLGRASQGKEEGGNVNGGGGNEEMTRDFLGLRALPHRDILNMAGLDHCMSSSSSYDHAQQGKKPWN